MASTIEAEIESLESAEDFMTFFGLDYDEEIVKSKHIQLLRMFNHILEAYPKPWRKLDYKRALRISYHQLVNGNELAFHESACGGCTGCDDNGES